MSVQHTVTMKSQSQADDSTNPLDFVVPEWYSISDIHGCGSSSKKGLSDLASTPGQNQHDISS